MAPTPQSEQLAWTPESPLPKKMEQSQPFKVQDREEGESSFERARINKNKAKININTPWRERGGSEREQAVESVVVVNSSSSSKWIRRPGLH